MKLFFISVSTALLLDTGNALRRPAMFLRRPEDQDESRFSTCTTNTTAWTRQIEDIAVSTENPEVDLFAADALHILTLSEDIDVVEMVQQIKDDPASLALGQRLLDFDVGIQWSLQKMKQTFAGLQTLSDEERQLTLRDIYDTFVTAITSVTDFFAEIEANPPPGGALWVNLFEIPLMIGRLLLQFAGFIILSPLLPVLILGGETGEAIWEYANGFLFRLFWLLGGDLVYIAFFILWGGLRYGGLLILHLGGILVPGGYPDVFDGLSLRRLECAWKGMLALLPPMVATLDLMLATPTPDVEVIQDVSTAETEP